MNALLRCPTSVLAFALVVASAHGAVAWDESIGGDLSDTRSAPTVLTFTSGFNTVTGSSGFGNRDYFTFTLGPGTQLTALTLTSYAGPDGTGFIGVQAGSVMTVDPNAGSPAGLLGYTHFGTGPGNVGQDILPSMGLGAGADGFTPPLGAGSYTFWVQQLGSTANYSFQFTVIPEPSTVALGLGAGALLCAGIFRHRRTRAKSSAAPSPALI